MTDEIKNTEEEWKNAAKEFFEKNLKKDASDKNIDEILHSHKFGTGKTFFVSPIYQNVIDLEILRQKLKEIRKEAKLSQRVVAKGINTTHNLISRIETGGNDFKVGTLLKLLNVYGYEIILQKK